MIHPLLRLVATRPELLAEHAHGYAELLGVEFSRSTRDLKRRTIYGALGLCLVGVAATLGGVAAMLWAVTPPADLQSPWALLAAPLVPLIVGAWSLLQAREPQADTGFESLRDQLAADMAMLREVGST